MQLLLLMIGYGTMGAIHASKIKASGRLEHLVIVDTNPERLKKAEEDGYIAFADLESAYQWLEENSAKQEFDVLVVTSNTAAHYGHLEHIVYRDIEKHLPLPAIFVEKPLVATANEAFQLYQLIEENDLIKKLNFMCAYLLRESPAVEHLIEKIKQAQDTIKEIKIVWQKEREPKRPSAGVVQDETTHSLDLVQYIMSELVMDTNALYPDISSATRTTKVVDQAAQNILYPEGDKNRNPIAEIEYSLQLGDVKVQALSSFLVGPQQRTIEFIGEHNTYLLRFDEKFEGKNADWCDEQPFPTDKISSLWNSFFKMIDGKHPKQVASFVQACNDVILSDCIEETADRYLHDQANPGMLFAFPASTAPATDSTTAKQKLVVVSLDYDSCGQHLFPDGRYFQRSSEVQKKYTLEESIFLINHLLAITEGQKTVLYVGSSRQDIATDESCENENENGSCFLNFAALVEEMNEIGRDWEFDRLLLSDIIGIDENRIKIDRGLGMKDPLKYVPHDLLQLLDNDPNVNLKLNIIIMQLDDIEKNHPDKDISFYFYDDDAGINEPGMPSIFEAFKTHFTQFPEKIPSNVSLFLMHFDPYKRIQLRAQNIEPNSDLEYWRSLPVAIESEPEEQKPIHHKRRHTI